MPQFGRDRRRLSGGQFKNEDLVGTDLRNALAFSSLWVDCDFQGVKLSGSDFTGSIFIRCRFERCDFRLAKLIGKHHGSTFIRSDLDQAVFLSSEVYDCRFEKCRLQYTDFTRATVVRTSFRESDLHGAILNFAEGEDLDFVGANLWGAVVAFGCPFFVGSLFDSRQFGLFLGLLHHARSADGSHPAPFTEKKWQRVVDRLVGIEEAEHREESLRGTHHHREGVDEVPIEVETIGRNDSPSGGETA